MWNPTGNDFYSTLSFVEFTEISGKDNRFYGLLETFGIDCSGAMYDEEFTSVNWKQVHPHYQFFHDYVDGERDISNLLQLSDLSKSSYGYTWLIQHDPIIKVRTDELIQRWDEFHRASVEGFVFVVESGEHYCEFARYNLHSNFEIKKGTLVSN